MRIDVEKLAANGFKLDLAGNGPLLELGPSGAVTGYYETTPEELRIRAGASHVLDVTNLEWKLEPLVIELASHARLEGVQLGLVIPRAQAAAWSGGIGVREASVGAVDLQFAALDEPLELSGIEVERLEIERRDGRLEVKAEQARIARASLGFGGLRIEATRIELPEGFALEDQRLRLGLLRVRELSVTVEDVRAFLSARRGSGAAGEPLDLSFVDRLNGRLDVDLTVDATVPLIGRRRATHHFRIPIAEGSIDFKGVERNLSRLEDAVLDFAVRDGKLCLERDLPLVPFDRKALVCWELAPEELVMAKRNRVRLRRLRDYQIPEPRSAPDPGKKSGFELRSLHFDNVAVELDLRGPTVLPLARGRVRLGDDSEPALGSLSVRGDVRHDVSGTPDRTALRGAAEGILAGLDGVAIGALLLDAARLSIASLEDVALQFEGVKPGALEGVLRRVECRDLSLAW